MSGRLYRDSRVWVSILASGLAVWLLTPVVFPRRPPAVAEDAVPEIRYVCTETGEVFVRPLSGVALAHPTTGRPSLVPAVYDAKRKKWRPGPPLEVMRRQGLLQPAS